jgi:hypothetical protein
MPTFAVYILLFKVRKMFFHSPIFPSRLALLPPKDLPSARIAPSIMLAVEAFLSWI